MNIPALGVTGASVDLPWVPLWRAGISLVITKSLAGDWKASEESHDL